MCQKRNSVEIPYVNQANNFAKVDECISKELIKLNKKGISTLASCCGHGRYKKSIVILCRNRITKMEYFTKKVILNWKRFYKKDRRGYYYIPKC